MSDLREWLDSVSPISVRVMTGAAGHGKSRLAIELIDEVTSHGWHAGFLTRTELKRFCRQYNTSEWGWNKPALVIVDYAAASARDLNAWLTELASNLAWEDTGSKRVPPFRVLLIERHAQRGRGWWVEAFGIGRDAQVLERMLDPPTPYDLGPIVRPDQRREILTKTLACLGSTVRPPQAGTDHDFDRRLSKLTWGGVPLLLMMAGATAAREGLGHVLAMGSDELAINIAETELDRVRQVAIGSGLPAGLAPLVDHVTAVTTMLQGLTVEQAVDMIRQESAALGYDVPGGPAVLRDALAKAFSDDLGCLAAVEPDLIAEALLLRVWKPGNTTALPAISRAYANKGPEAADTIIRTCQDYVSRGHRHPITWLSRIFEDSADDLDALSVLSDSMPQHTLELRETAAEVSTAIVKHAKSRTRGSEDPQLKARLAQSLNNLSNRLGHVGRKEAALAAVDEAIEICRTLITTDPHDFRALLAMFLNNRAVHLSHVGQRENALAASQEAVDICRALAADGLDVIGPDLAMSLTNLSNRLSDLARFDEGLVAANEATELYRRLARKNPEPFRAELAGSLNNLSSRLSRVGRLHEALNAVEEGAYIYRDLAAARHDSFRSALAMSLNNLSNRLSEMERLSEALVEMQRAVAIAREIADDWPDFFRSYLAMYLSNLSARLSDVGRHHDALGAVVEAVSIRRDLAADRPDVSGPELSISLSLLSDSLSQLSRTDDALDAIQEAVATLREPFMSTPTAFARRMAIVTTRYRQLCKDTGRHQDASLIGPIDAKLGDLSRAESANDQGDQADGRS